jgi:bacterioferritin (cytochrome b1)
MNKESVILLLKDLLQREFLQRDIYETYSFYLFGKESPAIQEHLKVHLQEELLHIETLQRYLMGLGASPVTTRTSIPSIQPLTLDAILDINFELEQAAVKKYSEAIEALEGDVTYTSIRVDLEDILKQEQEHTHDLIQWLGRWKDVR